MEFLSILLKFYFNEMFLLIKNFVSFVKGNLIFIYFLINNYFYLSFIHILIIINQNLAQNSFQTGHQLFTTIPMIIVLFPLLNYCILDQNFFLNFIDIKLKDSRLLKINNSLVIDGIKDSSIHILIFLNNRVQSSLIILVDIFHLSVIILKISNQNK